MAFALRMNIITPSRTYFRNIMTSTRKMEKAIEKLQTNPYFEKYAQKIAVLQKTSPEEFISRTEQQEKAKPKPKLGPVDTRQYSSVLNPKAAINEKVATKEKSLDSIFKIELVKDKDADEIQQIWEEYHKQQEVIAATIPVEAYTQLRETAKKNPTFLFPLPRSQGYEFIMCQFSGNSVHFTPLLCYQVHKENAPECLTMVHYTEFSDKGLILMRGEYDKNVIDGKEAQCLANQYQIYYGNKNSRKTELLKTFTKKPDVFKHMDLIAELEKLTLG